MILPMLGDVKAPENEEKKKAFLRLEEKPAVRKLFLDYLMDYLLLPYGSHPSLSFTDENGQEIKPKVPAGMCESSWKRIAGTKVNYLVLGFFSLEKWIAFDLAKE